MKLLGRWNRFWKELWKDEQGIGTVEMILILVGIFTPYYRVGIRCMA